MQWINDSLRSRLRAQVQAILSLCVNNQPSYTLQRIMSLRIGCEGLLTELSMLPPSGAEQFEMPVIIFTRLPEPQLKPNANDTCQRRTLPSGRPFEEHVWGHISYLNNGPCVCYEYSTTALKTPAGAVWGRDVDRARRIAPRLDPLTDDAERPATPDPPRQSDR